ncbi:M23 family metallopeptidase [[Limnothrix rosea] IAM M-220]|uniref:M23 family metallopeptidase n=1 Tax=[Limnothrix rosea] IAM M-220 TaxID=454133 RepID=UPI000963A83D|nr:M23 family metallopeptidase [[Limnothrix rosea] IAM M-220]OKH19824.1 hypothetical protein NIES208_01315 [[Limnothrix rosea] IAM M-220]
MITGLMLTQVLLPLVLIVWMAIAPLRNVMGFWLQAAVTATVLWAIANMGLWILPPWWTPYLYGLLFIIALGIGWRWHKPTQKMPSNWLGWVLVTSLVAFGVFAGNEAVSSWLGQFPPSLPSVNLSFPLRGGDYLILNGGSDIRINAHLKTMDESVPRFRAYRGNGYAVDIVQIDRFGWRATGILPRDLSAYKIYGQPVLAPCDGQIIQAVDHLPDMQIPEVDRENLAGNHVILRCDDIDILLAHFRPQSLAVQAGVNVKVGDRLAEVGNSGASNEPHLHIHAQRPGLANTPFSGDPLPMSFDGRFLVRGDRLIK